MDNVPVVIVLRKSVVLCLSLTLISCNGKSASKIQVTTAENSGGSTDTLNVDKVSPSTPQAGDTVTLQGANFQKSATLKVRITLPDGSYKDVELVILSDSTATFKMPEGLGVGLRSLEIISGSGSSKSISNKIVSKSGSESKPLIAGLDKSKICNDMVFIDGDGKEQTGTRNCNATAVASCSSNGETDCLASSSYTAANFSNVVVGNIKSSVSIGGVTGQFPSATYTLSGASSTADFSSSTLNAQLTSATAFEYWGSDGTRYTGAGSTDIVAANILSGVTVFGVAGSLVAASTPDPWDVRYGVTVGSVTGALKTSCRNRIISSYFNYDGSIGSISNSTVTSGSSLDIWDTIDDGYNESDTYPTSVVSGWSDYDCQGVEALGNTNTSDPNVWKDVTASSNCTSTPASCTMKDKITGLWWSKMLPGTSQTWSVAVQDCNNLSHNGVSSGNWRLPTQHELQTAYEHGIKSAISANWITGYYLKEFWWSSTTVSDGTNYAWATKLSRGYMWTIPKTSTTAYLTCVYKP